MTDDNNPFSPRALSRRRFLIAGVGAPALVAASRVVAGAGPGSSAHATKQCIVTEDNIEGPFFKAHAPSRVVLATAKTKGTHLALSGQIVDTACRPIAGAIMEVWQADHRGDYDNRGFGFRATLRSRKNGGFDIQTIIPGRYLNGDRYRPAHIHVKLHARGFRPLTTQLYFQGDPYNHGDPFIRRSLIMPLRTHGAGKAAHYRFVLAKR